MSCYEWERGEIVLPTKDWPTFRRKLIEAWNAYHLADGEDKGIKKKDLPLLPVTRDATLVLGEASIRLVNAKRMVIWDVPENNHACEWARRHPVAQTLFRLLDQIKWTRGSGGMLLGNDEYNRDSDWEGGGGNYATGRYGPRGKHRPEAWW